MRRPGGVLLAAAALAACAVSRRSTDPTPTFSSAGSPPELAARPLPAPEVAEPTTVRVATPTATTATAATAATTTAAAMDFAGARRSVEPAAPPRTWGQVAITTSIVSPSQLMGAELPYSPRYKRLPVFPEALSLAVSWGFLDVGEATLKVSRIVLFNGRPAYHLVSEARSNAFCDTFYSVRDLNESWLDAETLTSLGYSKKLREGGFFRDEWVLYDRDAGTFVARRTNRDGAFAVRVGTIPAQLQDVLSSIYYVRAQDLKSDVVVDVNTPDNWPLIVRVKERETVKTPAGRFASILVEPEMRREGLFVQKGKRLRLWLSDDAAKRPLVMKVEVFFGHVTASLREML